MQRRQFVESVVAAVAATIASLKIMTVSASSAAPTKHIIAIKNFAYSPQTISVRKQDHVTWINLDIVPHTATAVDGSWDTGNIGPGERREIIVKEGLIEDYYCRYHPAMTARLDAE